MSTPRRTRRDLEFGRELSIGDHYRRRSDGQIAAVRQVHRHESVAELVTDFGRRSIAFSVLRTEWDQLVAHDTSDGVSPTTSWLRDHHQHLDEVPR